MDLRSAQLVAEAMVVWVAVTLTGAVLLYLFVRSRSQAPDFVQAMNLTVNELSERITELERQRRHDHETIMNTLEEVEKWKAYARVLAQLLVELNQDVPPAPDATLAAAGVDDRMLQQTIGSLFNLEEIDDLAFRMGIDTGELDGATVGRRARSLVTFARRHGQVDVLAGLVRQLRPEANL